MAVVEKSAYLAELESRGWRLGLDRIRAACAELKYPQLAYPVVIVAGTNGKGSIACMLQRLARAHGLKTGLYTSPSLKTINERIVVDGEMIEDRELDRLVSALYDVSEKHRLSHFEFLTLAAFNYFRARGVALAVLEVGMGGRLDATNVAEPTTAVITPIGIDHTEQLGTDVTQIAAEKCGVLRKGATVVCAAQDNAAMEVIKGKTGELGASLHVCGEHFRCSRRLPADFASPEVFDYREGDFSLESVELGLRGVFQPANASVAMAALSVLSRRFKFKLDEKAVRGAFADVFWPARFQILSKDPPVVIDGAHNPHGASALADTLRERCGGGKAVFVFGAMADKDYRSVIGLLAPLAEEVIVTGPDSPRALDPEIAKKAWERLGVRTKVVKNPEMAMELAREGTAARLKLPVVACGSLYLVGGYLEPGWKL